MFPQTCVNIFQTKTKMDSHSATQFLVYNREWLYKIWRYVIEYKNKG